MTSRKQQTLRVSSIFLTAILSLTLSCSTVIASPPGNSNNAGQLDSQTFLDESSNPASPSGPDPSIDIASTEETQTPQSGPTEQSGAVSTTPPPETGTDHNPANGAEPNSAEQNGAEQNDSEPKSADTPDESPSPSLASSAKSANSGTPKENPSANAKSAPTQLAITATRTKYPAAKLDKGETRLGGADRYTTAVQVSKQVTAESRHSQTVYIASGADYPDALSLGALAARSGAPLLLTKPTSLPAVTATELTALSPSKIIIAGGPDSVSSGVAKQLGKYAKVERISGADRYATSKAIAARFPKGTPAFVTSGNGFADATVAAAPAAKTGGPVILTALGSAHPSSLDALTKLRPSDVYIIGGTWPASSLSSFKAAGHSAPVILSGADRYKTSVKAAEEFWDSSQEIFAYASGVTYPDALTGVSVTKAYDAPLLLTVQGCRPQAASSITKKQTAYILLGGKDSVSSKSGLGCQVKSGKVDFQNGVYTFANMRMERQATGYYCGPSAGVAALSSFGQTRSVHGQVLSQYTLAGSRYMATDVNGATFGEDNMLVRGLNAFIGTDIYKRKLNVTGDDVRRGVLDSFKKTGRPVVLETVEYPGAAHYNGHPPYSSFGHYVTVYGYDTKTDELLIFDPIGGAWAGSKQVFRYDTDQFVKRFLGNEWWHGMFY